MSNLLIKIFYEIGGWIDRSVITKAVQRKQLKHNLQITSFAIRKVHTLALWSEHTFYHYVGRKCHSHSLIILF